jgi:uncharacterized protein
MSRDMAAGDVAAGGLAAGGGVRGARATLVELLQRAAANDPAQGDLYADDAIHEVPWAPAGKPMTMTAPMLRAAISAAGDPPLQDQTLDVRSLISEGDVACAEYAMTGTLRRSGEQFQLSGVMVIRVRAGQIVHSRSYMDPQALASLAG